MNSCTPLAAVNSFLELDILRTEVKLSSASVTLVQIKQGFHWRNMHCILNHPGFVKILFMYLFVGKLNFCLNNICVAEQILEQFETVASRYVQTRANMWCMS